MHSHTHKLLTLALSAALCVAALIGLGCGAGDMPGAALSASESPATGSVIPDPETAGQIAFRVAWPEADSVEAKLIPTGTDHLQLTVRPGAGMDPEISDTIAKSDVQNGFVSKVYDLAAGQGKEVTVEAIAADGQVAATATVTTDVVALQETQIALTLESTGLFDPVVSASADPASITEGESLNLSGTASDPDGSLTLLEWDCDGDGTFECQTTSVSGGGFTRTESPAVGTYTATFRATDNDDQTTSVSISYEVTSSGGGGAEAFDGVVTDVFSGDVVSGATVSVGGLSATTDASGGYSISGLTDGTQRMEVTHGSYVTRSFEVAVVAGGTQDVSMLPGTYNTRMMRALYKSGIMHRWDAGNAPTFVIYTKYLADGTNPRDVYQSMIDHFVDVIENVLPTMTNGVVGGPGSIEYYDCSRPEDDPRLTVVSSRPWAYILDRNLISITVTADIANYTGYAGAQYTSDNWIIGGGATIEDNYAFSYYRTFRHELLHTLGFAHPFEQMSSGDWPTYMENSIMNYGSAAAYDADDYTTADITAMQMQYHRAPGNVSPDSDPSGHVGFRSGGQTTLSECGCGD